MAIFLYQAAELYQWIVEKKQFLLLDVRNKVDFGRFKVEGPRPVDTLNISYFDFMEIEDECVARLPSTDDPVRIVCAKEGSAKYVAEILERHGYTDVGYLAGGIKSWGNLLVPKLLEANDRYHLYQCIRPGKGSCSYVLQSGGEMMVFDPSRSIDFYSDFARRAACRIIATAETHLQADYIAGSRQLGQRTGARIYANPNDFAGAKFTYHHLSDQEILPFSTGGPDVKAVFAPGHTPGSTLYSIDDRFLITGDIVFIKSIGRPDLGGKAEEWSASLFATVQRIKQLDGGLMVLPGHFIEWGEADENLCFTASLATVLDANKEIYSIDNPDDFLAFIKQNMRQQPPEYAEIRLVNANLKEVDEERAEILDLGKNECAASAYAARQKAA